MNWKIFELFFVFILLPFLFSFEVFGIDLKNLFSNSLILQRFYLLGILYTFFFIYLFVSIYNFYNISEFFKFKNFIKNIKYLKVILIRFFFIVISSIIFTYFFYPEQMFLFFKNQNYLLIFFVSIFYPILSVFPQEFIFRIYFLQRFQTLFPKEKEMILANSAFFMFLHIIYQNWISLIFSFIGNFLFVKTFLKTNSFWFAFFEHSLYGIWIFYLGLGTFFI